MKYLQKVNSIKEAIAFKKAVAAEGNSRTFTIYSPSGIEIYTTPAKKDPIILQNFEGEKNEIFDAIIDNKLLGEDYDYVNDTTILLKSDISNITTLGSAFSGSIENKNLIISSSRIEDLSILEKFEGIKDISGVSNGKYQNLFALASLVKVRLPKRLKEIGNSAFAFCLDLSDIEIPNSVKAIRTKAFYNCIELKTLTFPKTLEIIENNVFNKCSNLTSLYFTSDVPPTIYKDTFNGINEGFILYVPKNSYNDYLVKWGKYADKIKKY